MAWLLPIFDFIFDHPQSVLAPAAGGSVTETWNAPEPAAIHRFTVILCPFAPALVGKQSLGFRPIQSGAFNDGSQAGVGFRANAFGVDGPGIAAHVLDFTAQRPSVFEQCIAPFHARPKRIGDKAVGYIQLESLTFGVMKDVPLFGIRYRLPTHQHR